MSEQEKIKEFAKMIAISDNDFEIKIYNCDANPKLTSLFFATIAEEVAKAEAIKKETQKNLQD